MTKTIFKKISLNKEHEKALEEATSEVYLKKVAKSDTERKTRFQSIRNNSNKNLSSAMARL